jgi:signal transduction histidine kinase
MVGLLTYSGFVGLFAWRAWTVPTVVVASSMSVALRRRWPLPVALGGAAALMAVGLAHQGPRFTNPFNVLLWVPFLLCYSLGTGCRWEVGLAGTIAVLAGLQWANGQFNPLLEMLTFGPWAAGLLVESRRRTVEQIEMRNRSLEAERALFAQESVRYERARIARDLHDVVGHCVSMMVIQASAGQLQAAADPGSAERALCFIAETAVTTRREIGLLVELLEEDDPHARGLDTIEELVGQATRAGLSVRYSLPADGARASPAVCEVIYRVVREALTNAMRHAPGTAVEVVINDKAGELSVEIVNPLRPGSSGPDSPRSGRGLLGMRQRVAESGGSFTAGPGTNGEWRARATWLQ